jgi:hypothetical protein
MSLYKRTSKNIISDFSELNNIKIPEPLTFIRADNVIRNRGLKYVF